MYPSPATLPPLQWRLRLRMAHNPFFASRESFSNPSRTVSPCAYFRYHQHQPCLTSE
jgi:hypothetical protein